MMQNFENDTNVLHFSKYGLESQEFIFYKIEDKSDGKYITFDFIVNDLIFRINPDKCYMYRGLASGDNPVANLNKKVPNSKHTNEKYNKVNPLDYFKENKMVFTMKLSKFFEFDRTVNILNIIRNNKKIVDTIRFSPEEIYYICDNYVNNDGKGRINLPISKINLYQEAGCYFDTDTYISIDI